MEPPSTDETVDPISRTGRGASREDEVVELEILFHSDLSRVGEILRLGSARGDCELALGRDAPAFGPLTHARPLADPCVSREQLMLSWSASRRRFSARPCAGARRELSVFDRAANPVAGDAESPCLVAVGDRILLLAAARLPSEARALGLTGRSHATTALRERILELARIDDTVLIVGETGTGKELVARALHDASARARGPFVAVNCAALPEALVESELFGHVAGAFSGALRAKDGLFVAARGGTVLLDELGEMPLPTQAKLLRALQERAVRPVGAHHEVPFDARIVCATHRQLDLEAAEGRFRADLLARVDGVRVAVPPLGARVEDVPLLFTTFLTRRAASAPALARLFRPADSHRPPLPLSMFLGLLRHSWPRNVRELDKYAAAFVARSSAEGPPVVPMLEVPIPADRPASAREGAIDERRLLEVLEAHDYVQSRAAQSLGVPHATFDRWMREMRIVRPRDLERDVIARALRESRTPAEAARRLRVSERGLVLRARELDVWPKKST